ncbi:unnamed protein product [Ostreobium quekettii]|uniref:Uncharacterized protein n=1 Tax=Ostreobium quekettii TaxID=121088 RepID=A0A8S1JEF7_9CHLO|nr:unnamed protein product [Ostreobium quekettii]
MDGRSSKDGSGYDSAQSTSEKDEFQDADEAPDTGCQSPRDTSEPHSKLSTMTSSKHNAAEENPQMGDTSLSRLGEQKEVHGIDAAWNSKGDSGVIVKSSQAGGWDSYIEGKDPGWSSNTTDTTTGGAGADDSGWNPPTKSDAGADGGWGCDPRAGGTGWGTETKPGGEWVGSDSGWGAPAKPDAVADGGWGADPRADNTGWGAAPKPGGGAGADDSGWGPAPKLDPVTDGGWGSNPRPDDAGWGAAPECSGLQDGGWGSPSGQGTSADGFGGVPAKGQDAECSEGWGWDSAPRQGAHRGGRQGPRGRGGRGGRGRSFPPGASPIAAAEQALEKLSLSGGFCSDPSIWQSFIEKASLISKTALANILQFWLQEEFQEDWPFIVTAQPPWDFEDVLNVYDKHFGRKLPLRVRAQVKENLLGALKLRRRDSGSAEVAIKFVQTARELLYSTPPPKPNPAADVVEAEAADGSKIEPVTYSQVSEGLRESRVEMDQVLSEMVSAVELSGGGSGFGGSRGGWDSGPRGPGGSGDWGSRGGHMERNGSGQWGSHGGAGGRRGGGSEWGRGPEAGGRSGWGLQSRGGRARGRGRRQAEVGALGQDPDGWGQDWVGGQGDWNVAGLGRGFSQGRGRGRGRGSRDSVPKDEYGIGGDSGPGFDLPADTGVDPKLVQPGTELHAALTRILNGYAATQQGEGWNSQMESLAAIQGDSFAGWDNSARRGYRGGRGRSGPGGRMYGGAEPGMQQIGVLDGDGSVPRAGLRPRLSGGVAGGSGRHNGGLIGWGAGGTGQETPGERVDGWGEAGVGLGYNGQAGGADWGLRDELLAHVLSGSKREGATAIDSASAAMLSMSPLVASDAGAAILGMSGGWESQGVSAPVHAANMLPGLTTSDLQHLVMSSIDGDGWDAPGDQKTDAGWQ